MEFNYPSTSSELPGYYPSSPSPSYTCELACGERLLEHTPRSQASRPPPTSLFIKKAGRTSIVLNEQEDGATIPTYGRRALISGNLFLEQSESILDIVLKVEAKLDYTISDAGGQSNKLVADSYTLWSHSTSQGTSCPSQIPFSVFLPATFKHNGNAVPLPPSYNATYFSVPSLFVRSAYQLHIIVSRVRHQKVGGIWPKTKHILIPFTYSPKTRPHRPIVPSPGFFSSVKTSPEEWFQAVTLLKTRPNANIDPINVHLFVPGGRIYGLTDTIPFHIQVAGITCSLRKLFSDSLLDRVMSVDSHNTVVTTTSRKANTKPLVRVCILRQVSVNIKGDNSWKNNVLTEGTIWPIPPDLGACCLSTSSNCEEGHIDWEGELRCGSDVAVGGFMAGNVQVKDFIALTISPPTPFTTPLLELQLTIPIRLVTDSFSEVAGLEGHTSQAPIAAAAV